MFDDNVSILATEKTSTSNSNSEHTQRTNNNHQQPSVGSFKIQYNDILTFIQGSLLIASSDASDEDARMEGEESAFVGGTPMQHQRIKVPRLQEIARGKNSKYHLDDKQYDAK